MSTTMPNASIPKPTAEEIFPNILPNRPAKNPSRISQIIHSRKFRITIILISALSLAALAVVSGIQIGQKLKHHANEASSSTSTVPAIEGTTTIYVTATEVTTVPSTIQLTSQQPTTLVTRTLPEATQRPAKCAGGAYSHPECQVE